jgi:hypothetical protein
MSELAHYGVKGMKWGVIRDTAGSAAGSAQAVATKAGRTIEKKTGYAVVGRQKANTKQIEEARQRLQKQNDDYRGEYKKYKKAAKGGDYKAKLEAGLRKREQDFMKDPDRVIAMRMTRGEKAMAILGGISSTLGTSGLAAPVAATAVGGSIAGMSAASRKIEQKQRTGAYNKQREGKVRRGLLMNDARTKFLVNNGAGAVAFLGSTAAKVGVGSLNVAKAVILDKAARNRAAATAASKIAKPMAIGAKAFVPKYAKKGARGAYKITTMK